MAKKDPSATPETDGSLKRQVDEAVREEALRHFFQRHSGFIIAVIGVILLSVGGQQYYRHYRTEHQERYGDELAKVMRLAEVYVETTPGEKEEDLEALAQQIDTIDTSFYRFLALFHLAGKQAEAGEFEGALAHYDRIMQEKALPQEMRDIARLRAAYLAVGKRPREEILGWVSPLLERTDSRVGLYALEVSGAAALLAGDTATAMQVMRELIDSIDAMNASQRLTVLRNRAENVMALAQASFDPGELLGLSDVPPIELPPISLPMEGQSQTITIDPSQFNQEGASEGQDGASEGEVADRTDNPPPEPQSEAAPASPPAQAREEQ